MKRYALLLLNILLSGCYSTSSVGYQDVYDDTGGTVVYVDSPTVVYTPSSYATTVQTSVIYTNPQVTYVSMEPEIVYYESPFFTPPYRPIRSTPHFKPMSPRKHYDYSYHNGKNKRHTQHLNHDVHIKKPTYNSDRSGHHKSFHYK